MPPEIPRASRSLLTPGPQPPLSHLGVTLLRHVVATGLRYSLYQLGLPAPEAAPVRILQLRLFLDGAALEELFGGRVGGPETTAALLDPAGSGELPRAARPLRVAAGLHRARLRLLGLRWGGGRSFRRREGQSEPHGGLWDEFEARLGDALPELADAVLAEIVTSIERRRRRQAGRPVPPARPREAWRLCRGRRARLERLGHPDPLLRSWSHAPERAGELGRAAGGSPSRLTVRGCFRERYRGFLSSSRPALLALGERAARRGLMREPEDVFFLPFEVLADLEREASGAGWIEAAVSANRREHDARLREPEYPDVIGAGETPAGRDRCCEWDAAPILPLA